jgi:hypothetical protein
MRFLVAELHCFIGKQKEKFTVPNQRGLEIQEQEVEVCRHRGRGRP